MQDRIYRFDVKRSLVNAVFAAHDTVTGADVTIYEWTPPAEVRQQARETLNRMAEGLEAEVFSLDASLYLVVSSVEQARRVLPVLRAEGLFPGHWPGEEPVRPAPPPPPPPPPPTGVKTSTASPGARTPEYTPVPKPIPPPPAAPSRRGRLLKLSLLLLLIAVIGLIVYALNQDSPAKPAAILVTPRLSVEPAQAHPGERVSLKWSTSGYDRVQLDGQRIDAAGNRLIVATTTRAFRLVAVAADGKTATAEARLIVTPARTRAGKPSAGELLTSPANPQP